MTKNQQQFNCPMGEKDIVVSEVGPGNEVGFRGQCPRREKCHAPFPDGTVEGTAQVSGSRKNPKTRNRAPKALAQKVNESCIAGQEAGALLGELTEALLGQNGRRASKPSNGGILEGLGPSQQI